MTYLYSSGIYQTVLCCQKSDWFLKANTIEVKANSFHDYIRELSQNSKSTFRCVKLISTKIQGESSLCLYLNSAGKALQKRNVVWHMFLNLEARDRVASNSALKGKSLFSL